MLVKEILYNPVFVRELKKLDAVTRAKVIRCEEFFRANPLHPSLRLHPLKGKLKGLWSISVTVSVRIIFQRMSRGEIVFLSVGKYDIYREI